MPSPSSMLMAARPGAQGWSIPWGDFAFVRATEGSYLTGAPGTGSSAFLAWASAGTLREEDRGDGAGPLALLEGQRTNSVIHARAFENAWFTSVGAVTVTADAGPGLDGTTTATRAQAAANTNRSASNLGVGCLSAWARAYSGTSGWNIGVDGVVAAGVASLGTTYQRRAVYKSPAGTTYLFVDGFNRSGVGGVAAHSYDLLLDLLQFEAGARWPSSAIRTSGSSATRNADELTKTTGVPAALYTGRGRFAQCSPVMPSGDVISGDVHWLLSIGGSSNGLRIRHTGTDIRIEAVEGGTVRASSQALAWGAEHALLGPVAWDPAAGLVYVNGVAGPAGTAWSWTAAAIRVGGIYGSSGAEAYARLGTLESW